MKGQQRSVQIFEIRGRRAPEPAERSFLDAYAAALADYREGRWAQAERSLAAARTLQPRGDGACDALLARIRRLDRKPPADWDGIWTFEEK